MNACTSFDAPAFMGMPKSYFSGVDETRISFRGNELNKRYAAWAIASREYADHV